MGFFAPGRVPSAGRTDESVRMNGPSDSDDQMLAAVKRAVSGDTTALTLVLMNLHADLCAYLNPRIPPALRGQLDAEDVLQQTYVQVFRHVARFVPRDPDAFRRWVCTIALRRLRNEICKLRTAKRGGGARAVDGRLEQRDSWIGLIELLSAPGRSPSRCAARAEAVAAVESALSTLPEHYQQAIRLVYLQGWSVAAAATQMNKTERAIHGLCRRGLDLLRSRMGSASGFLSSGS